MNKYISFLLIPMILLGTNYSSCYSMDAAGTMKHNNTNGNIELDISKLIADFRERLENIFNNHQNYYQTLYNNFGALMYDFYYGIEKIFRKYNSNFYNELLKIYDEFIILHNNISYIVASYYTDDNEDKVTIVNPSQNDFKVIAKSAFSVMLNLFEKLSNSKSNNNISKIKKSMIENIVSYVQESEIILKDLYNNSDLPIFDVRINLIQEIKEKLEKQLNDDNVEVEIDYLISQLQNMSIQR